MVIPIGFDTQAHILLLCTPTQLISHQHTTVSFEGNWTGLQLFSIPSFLPITLSFPMLYLKYHFVIHQCHPPQLETKGGKKSFFPSFHLPTSLQSAAPLLLLLMTLVADCSTTHCEREYGLVCSGMGAFHKNTARSWKQNVFPEMKMSKNRLMYLLWKHTSGLGVVWRKWSEPKRKETAVFGKYCGTGIVSFVTILWWVIFLMHVIHVVNDVAKFLLCLHSDCDWQLAVIEILLSSEP